MSDPAIALARQPILARDKTLRGYELLYRCTSTERAEVTDADHATASVALTAMTELGLDRVVGQHRAWINVPRSLILEGLVTMLPADRVVIELLEDQIVDSRLLTALYHLREEGYTIALDDFVLCPETSALLDVADVVKLDLLALGAEQFAADAATITQRGITLLGEKIETQPDFTLALNAGCELVQGYFFCRPEVMRAKRIAPNQLTALKLATAAQDPAVDLSELTRIIARDVALSYRLLRYVNSAYIGLRHHVDSPSQATALLGLEHVRQWLTITTLSGVGDKPRELIATALVRGRFCQQAGRGLGLSSGELFTLGMFSVLDALTDSPFDAVLSQLPFTPQMTDALLHRTGPGRLLDQIESIEAGGLDLNPEVAEDYADALIWTTEVAERMLSP